MTPSKKSSTLWDAQITAQRPSVVIVRIWNSGAFWAFFSTALRLGGFVFILPLTLRRLSSDHLGIWYTMQSLSSLVLMLEPGFSACIGRFAGFYFAGARKVPSLGIDPPQEANLPPNYPALAGLVVMARSFYQFLALGILVLMGSGGLWMAHKFGPVFLRPDVLSAYAVFSVGLAVMMAGFFWGDLLFGINQVQKSYRNTILGLVLNYVVIAVLFLLGFGLLSLAAGQIVLALLPRWMARKQFLKAVPLQDVTTIQETRIGELWPMCWRTGLSAIAAYLLLRNMPLIAASQLDLKSTASLGLCLQLCFAISGISQIWLVVKYPVIFSLRVKRDYPSLRRLVAQRMPLCVLTYLAGAAMLLVVGPWGMHLIGSHTPLLSNSLFALLLFIGALDLIIGLCSALLLSENRVSFMIPTLISGIATTVVGLILGHFWGIIGIILAPALVQVLWIYWWIPLTCWRSLNLEPALPATSLQPTS